MIPKKIKLKDLSLEQRGFIQDLYQAGLISREDVKSILIRPTEKELDELLGASPLQRLLGWACVGIIVTSALYIILEVI